VSNLFADSPPKSSKTMAEKATSAWLYEIKAHGLLSLNFTREVYATHVGHWVEMNWHDVIEIGCEITNCTDGLGDQFPGSWSFVVCVYNPGNFKIDILYFQFQEEIISTI
jgi:hypothetical protein